MAGTDVVAIVEIVDEVAGTVDNSLGAFKAIAVARAFREYSWMRSAPLPNISGNFRGMVISPRWKAAFKISSDLGEKVGNAALLASFAVNLVTAKASIERTLKSKDSWDVKASMLSLEASSAALRTLAGVFLGPAHLLTLALQGYCELGDVATGQRYASPRDCVKTLQSAEAWVTSQTEQLTDADNMYHIINTRLVYAGN